MFWNKLDQKYLNMGFFFGVKDTSHNKAKRIQRSSEGECVFTEFPTSLNKANIMIVHEERNGAH